MPRDGSNIYHRPPGTDGVPNYTIESAKYNANVADVEQDLNLPRPIVAGGTGASSVDGALDNLSAEKFKQVVTNWDTNVWRAGSFYAATSATGTAPVAAHAFAGIVYYANATDFVIEATDLTADGKTIYMRVQKAGVWGPWISSTLGTAKKNYIINGAMMISQEWGSTPLSTLGQYPVDMFQYNGNPGTGVVSFGQVGSTSATARIRFTVTTIDTTVDAGDAYFISHPIEGFRFTDLNSGSASAKTITLQFGVRAPAGTYCVAFRNAAFNRTYIAEYVIAAGEANTDVVKSVTLTLDTAGTWAGNNTAGVNITWALSVGSTYRTTAGAWTAGSFLASANQFNFFGTFGNVFELFDVSLTEGTVAPPFVVPDYASELATCMRYFEVWENPSGSGPYTQLSVGAANLNNTVDTVFAYKCVKRTTPTISVNGVSNFLITGNTFAAVFGCNTVTATYANPYTATLRATMTATTLTPGQVAGIAANNTFSAKLFINARP